MAEMQPDPQQQVIQHHVGFAPPHQVEEVAPIDAGEFDAKTLVEPERATVEASQSNPKSGSQQQDKGNPVSPSRGRKLRGRGAGILVHTGSGWLHAGISVGLVSRSYYARKSVSECPGAAHDSPIKHSVESVLQLEYPVG